MNQYNNEFIPWIPVLSSIIGALAVVSGIFITQGINRGNERLKHKKAIKPELIRLVHLLHHHKQQLAYANNTMAFYYQNAVVLNEKLLQVEAVPEEMKYPLSKIDAEFENFKRMSNDSLVQYHKELGEVGRIESELMAKVFELEEFFDLEFVGSFSKAVMARSNKKELLNLLWDYQSITADKMEEVRKKFSGVLTDRLKAIEYEGGEIVLYIVNKLDV